jgi:CBS domain-containing protein
MGEELKKRGSALPVEAVLKEARLRHLTQTETVKVGSDVPVREVCSRMQETRTGGVLVVGPDGRLLGIFTERDFLDKLALPDSRARLSVDLNSPVKKLMTSSPRALSPDQTLGDAIRLMTEGGYRHIPLVEEDGKIFGLVSANDLVMYIAEHFPTEVYNLPPRLHQRIRTLDGG